MGRQQLYIPRRKGLKVDGINKKFVNAENDRIQLSGDPWHNNQIPFCQILVELAQEVIPVNGNDSSNNSNTSTVHSSYSLKSGVNGIESTTTVSSTKSERATKGFASLIREYLAEDRRRHKFNTPATSSNKKKRRNKKKKKQQQQRRSDNSSIPPEQNEDSTATTITSKLSSECFSEDYLFSDDSKLTGNLDGRVYGSDATNDQNVRSKILEKFLDEKIASLEAVDATMNQQQLTDYHVSNSKHHTLQAFLEAVIEEEKASQYCIDQHNNGIFVINNTTSTLKNGRKSNGNSQVSHSSPSLDGCHVTFEQVEAALAAIACARCRGEVRKVYNSDFCLPVLLPTETNIDNFDQEEKAAFDYVAMEEGIFSTDSSGGTKSIASTKKHEVVFQHVILGKNGYEVGHGLQEKSGWRLRRVSRHCPGDSVSRIESLPSDVWKIENVETMIKQFVIMSGFSPDTLTGAVQLSDNEISSIAVSVDAEATKLTKKFRDIAEDLEQKVEVFVRQQGEDQHRFENGSLDPSFNLDIDMSTFPIIKETDSFCCIIIERLMKILWDLTRIVQRIIVASGNDNMALSSCQWAIGPSRDAWETFWQGVTSFSELVETYEQDLFQLCDRLGNIPPMYLNSQSRTIYRTLVEGKIRVVHNMILNIEKILNQQTSVDGHGCEGWSTCFIKKIYTVDSFYRVIAAMNDNERHRLHAPCNEAAFDKKCKQIFDYVQCTWSKTLVLQNYSRILATHHTEADELITLLRNIQSDLFPTDDLYNIVDEMVRKVPVPLAESSGSRPSFCKFMAKFWSDCLLHSVTRLESASSSTSEASTSTTSPALMPLKLRQSMVLTQSRQQGTALIHESNDCNGTNGRVRAVGILVGLFLKGWLLERYKEWFARIAEHELLTALDGGGTSTDVESLFRSGAVETMTLSNKSSSRKSKKKKVKLINTPEIDDDNSDASDERSNGFLSVATTADELISHTSTDKSTNKPLSNILETESFSENPCENTDNEHETSRVPSTSATLQKVTMSFAGIDDNERHQDNSSQCTPSLLVDTLSSPTQNESNHEHFVLSLKPLSTCTTLQEEKSVEADIVHETCQDGKQNNNFGSSDINVLVYSSTGFQSAETFLLDRFTDVISSATAK